MKFLSPLSLRLLKITISDNKVFTTLSMIRNFKVKNIQIKIVLKTIIQAQNVFHFSISYEFKLEFEYEKIIFVHSCLNIF